MGKSKTSWFFSLIVLMASVSFAADPELPLTWKGDGKVEFLTEDGLGAFEFKTLLSIDTDGAVSGKLYTDENQAVIKKLYYEPEYDGSRHIVLVVTHTDDEGARLYVMNARVLQGKFMYGEVFMKPLESEGSIEKGLYLNDPVAQEIYSDYLPKGLKEALNTCKPVGCFKIVGDYQN